MMNLLSSIHDTTPLLHRLLPLLLGGILLLMPIGRTEEAPAAGTADQSATVATSTADHRARISNPSYGTFSAEQIDLNYEQMSLDAQGDVEIDSPQGHFTADSLHYNTVTKTGFLDNAQGMFDQFHFKATTLTLDPNKLQHIQQARLTTCAAVNPHYAFFVRDAIFRPDHTLEARHVSLMLGGRTLFTIPRMTRKIGGPEVTPVRPPLLVGMNGQDGTYISTVYTYPLSLTSDVLLNARLGTKGIVRGDLALTKEFSLPTLGPGVVSLHYTRFEDAQNRVLSLSESHGNTLERLTLNREPAIEAALQPIALSGALHGFGVSLAASAGRYKENPTGVASDRAQLSTVLHTPAYRVGPLLVHGEFGAQLAYYSRDRHLIGVSQLTLETPPTSKYYFNISYVDRSENGTTPFLFDRVVIPHELYSEVEVPVHGSWCLGISNRYDIEQGNTRDLGITAIYKLDCLSYGLSYNAVGHSFNIGLVLNGFGSFRKGAGKVRFTQ